jgi:hypothetical protein
MKLFDQIYIVASPSCVWQVLGDLNMMKLWNPKCVSSQAGKGPFVAGYTYQATFSLRKGSERKMECMIEEYQQDKLLTIRYSGNIFKAWGYVTETYLLSAQNRGTDVKQIVDFTNSGVPFIVQLLMKFIHTLGYSAGKSSLKGIKELAEQNQVS